MTSGKAYFHAIPFFYKGQVTPGRAPEVEKGNTPIHPTADSLISRLDHPKHSEQYSSDMRILFLNVLIRSGFHNKLLFYP
jgi:hypothetical protein